MNKIKAILRRNAQQNNNQAIKCIMRENAANTSKGCKKRNG